MFTPIGKPRKLPYPLYNQVSNSNEVSTEGLVPNPVQWPEDSTERIPVILSVSLDEWNAIASSVDVGADIAYPEQYVEVWWILTRNLAYSMPICALMVDCILNDEDVGAAMVDSLAASPTFQQLVKQTANRATTDQITGKIIPAGCDKSAVAGRAIQAVDILDQNNQDFLEIVEVGTNDEERVALLLSAIPGLSESPADEILDLFQGLLENFSENYNAAITLAWKNEVAEDLYCLARQSVDCSLTYDQLFTYFANRAGSELTLASLIKNIVQFVINGDFSTDELIASGMYAIQLAFITAGRDFFGLNIPAIGAIVRDALPSTAWTDWGECYEGWCRSYTGSDLQSVFTPTGGLGAQALWVGDGYGANNAVINSRITLEGDLGSNVTVEEVVIIFDAGPTVSAINTVSVYSEDFIALLGAAAWVLETLVDIAPTAFQVFEIDTVSSFDTSVPITAKIVEIRVFGSGTPPSSGVEC